MRLRQNGRDRVGTPRIVPRMDSPESPNRGCAELLLSSTASSSSDRQIANVGGRCHRVQLPQGLQLARHLIGKDIRLTCTNFREDLLGDILRGQSWA
jgi:hypothetical protein